MITSIKPKLKYNDLNRNMRRLYLKDLKRRKFFISEEVIKQTDEYNEFINSIGDLLKEKFIINFLVDNVEVITSCDRLKLFINQKTVITTFLGQNSNGEILFKLRFTPYRDGVQLYLIKVTNGYRKNGLGQSLLDLCKSVSDYLDIPIYLIPVNDINDGIDYDRLVNFYIRNGFEKQPNIPYYRYEPIFEEVQEVEIPITQLNGIQQHYGIVG